MTDEIVERPGFAVGDQVFDTRDEAKEHVRMQALRRQVEQFAMARGTNDEGLPPTKRSATIVINHVLEWEAWKLAQARVEEVNP